MDIERLAREAHRASLRQDSGGVASTRSASSAVGSSDIERLARSAQREILLAQDQKSTTYSPGKRTPLGVTGDLVGDASPPSGALDFVDIERLARSVQRGMPFSHDKRISMDTPRASEGDPSTRFDRDAPGSSAIETSAGSAQRETTSSPNSPTSQGIPRASYGVPSTGSDSGAPGSYDVESLARSAQREMSFAPERRTLTGIPRTSHGGLPTPSDSGAPGSFDIESLARNAQREMPFAPDTRTSMGIPEASHEDPSTRLDSDTPASVDVERFAGSVQRKPDKYASIGIPQAACVDSSKRLPSGVPSSFDIESAASSAQGEVSISPGNRTSKGTPQASYHEDPPKRSDSSAPCSLDIESVAISERGEMPPSPDIGIPRASHGDPSTCSGSGSPGFYDVESLPRSAQREMLFSPDKRSSMGIPQTSCVDSSVRPASGVPGSPDIEGVASSAQGGLSLSSSPDKCASVGKPRASYGVSSTRSASGVPGSFDIERLARNAQREMSLSPSSGIQRASHGDHSMRSDSSAPGSFDVESLARSVQREMSSSPNSPTSTSIPRASYGDLATRSDSGGPGCVDIESLARSAQRIIALAQDQDSKTCSSDKRASMGIVLHDRDLELETVNGNGGTARVSIRFQDHGGGKRSSVLSGGPDLPGMPAKVPAPAKRLSLSAQSARVLPGCDGVLSEDDDSDATEDDAGNGGQEQAAGDCSDLSVRDPLDLDNLHALLEALQGMSSSSQHSANAASRLSQEQVDLLQSIMNVAQQLGVKNKQAEDVAISTTSLPTTRSTDSLSPPVSEDAPSTAQKDALVAPPAARSSDIRPPSSDVQHGTVARANLKPLARKSLSSARGMSGTVRRSSRRYHTEPADQIAVLHRAGEYFKCFLEATCIPDIVKSCSSLVACSVLAAEEKELADAKQHWPYSRMKHIPGLPWKAAKVWELLDLRTRSDEHKEKQMLGQRLVVVGAGPVGLRFALEAALNGAHVTVLEKRDDFVRINRLHLWDWVKQDLIGWGAKVFYPPGGTFGADKDYCHIGIRELQLLLLKCCLLLGVTVELGIEFKDAEWTNGKGWHVCTEPPLVNNDIVDALICCDGAASRCAEQRGIRALVGGLGREGQAIGVVANFTNQKTRQERDIRQFSWARQFNGTLFAELKKKVGADLENIVYYRGDENHYLIMTPTKQCLVDAGCLKSADPAGPLLDASNIEIAELQKLSRDVANHFGLPTTFTPTQSVMAFDFSDTRRHEQAMIFMDSDGGDVVPAEPLPVFLAGDALLEPFWPTGLGCIRGFLGAWDCLSNLQRWFTTRDRELVARRADAAYQYLKSVDAQTKDMTLKPDCEWRLDPATRYRGFREP